MPSSPVSGVSELHVHLEGSLSFASAVEIASARGHKWAGLSPGALRRQLRLGSFDGFLAAIREMCLVLCSYDALERAALELSRFLSASGVVYAEVYCSPYIFVRWGLEFGETLAAMDRGFARGEAEGSASCSILLDSVRQWGPEAARLVLDGCEAAELPRVVGFGLGGEESTPLEEFANIYERARGLGLRTVVHAGEVGPASDVRKAIDLLGADRIAHGIRALDDAALLAEIARKRIPLDVAITSNYRTGAVKGRHPLRELLDAGAVVTIGTDDPSIFRTDLPREYRRAATFGGATPPELAQIARNAVEASFAGEETKRRLRAALEERLR